MLSNGTFSMKVLECWSRWRGIFLTMIAFPPGGANTSELRSILEVLEVRTRFHMGLSQSSYYGDRQPTIHGTTEQGRAE